MRPGYKLSGGWPVGDPIIVVLVSDKKGDAQAYGLPATLGGVAIEIREAAPLERMKAIRPETYAMLKERTPAEEHQPEFPFQYSVVKAAPEAPRRRRRRCRQTADRLCSRRTSPRPHHRQLHGDLQRKPRRRLAHPERVLQSNPGETLGQHV